MSDESSFDDRERYDDPTEVLRFAIEAQRSRIWTALPVIIKKHDTDTNTAHVQPVVKLKHVKADNSVEWKEFPLIKDVPINYHGGGGATITMPLKDGDEGLMIVTSRDFSKWWNQGGVQEQVESHMHHISDAWLIPGGRSQPRKLSNVNPDEWELRTDDGSQKVAFHPVNKTITLTSPNPVQINAPSVKCSGDVIAEGEVIAKNSAAKIHLSTHTHNGVQSGGGNTNAPNSGT